MNPLPWGNSDVEITWDSGTFLLPEKFYFLWCIMSWLTLMIFIFMRTPALRGSLPTFSLAIRTTCESTQIKKITWVGLRSEAVDAHLSKQRRTQQHSLFISHPFSRAVAGVLRIFCYCHKYPRHHCSFVCYELLGFFSPIV